MCSSGHYCPQGKQLLAAVKEIGDQGSTSCSPCRVGHYCSSEHTSLEVMLLVMVCPAGLLCPGGQADAPDPRENACPQGYYCPQGDTGLQARPCPNGTFGGQRGLGSADECSPCPAGKFCYTNGMDPPGIPHPGFYCVQGSSKPEPCPEGTSSAKQGLSGPSECSPCARGFYCAAPGQTGPTGPCEAGFYCQGMALTPLPTDGVTGDVCPAGSYCPPGCPSPVPCPPGTYSNLSGLRSLQECLDCPPGWGFHLEIFAHKGIIAQLEPHTQKRCRVLLAPGMDREEPRMPRGACPVPLGFSATCLAKMLLWDFVHEEQVSQTLTEPQTRALVAHAHLGTSAQLVQVSHRDAPWALTQTGMEEKGGPCPVSHFCPEGSSFPSPCRAGTYNNLSRQAACSPCAAGYYCPENSTSYSTNPCPAGFYCPRGTRFATEFPCPRGYYNPDAMTQSLDSCLPCPPGHYCGKEGLTAASGQCDAGLPVPSGECAAGFYCEGQAVLPKPTDGVTGNICPVGTYCSTNVRDAHQENIVNSLALLPLQEIVLRGFGVKVEPEYETPRMESQDFFVPLGITVPKGISVPRAQLFQLLVQQDPITLPKDKPAASPVLKGHYCGLAGQPHVTGPCLAGFYCTGGASSPTPTDGLQGNMCPKGAYCPLGSAFPQPCPPGSYSSSTGNTGIEDCLLCDAGYFCDGTGLVSPTGLCEAGFYCSGGTISPKPPRVWQPLDLLGCVKQEPFVLLGHFFLFPALQEHATLGICVTLDQLSQTTGTAPLASTALKALNSQSHAALEVSTLSVGNGNQQTASSAQLGTPAVACIAQHQVCPSHLDFAIQVITVPREPSAQPPSNTGGTEYPVPCPPGSFSTSVGLEAEEQCQPCPAGHYCSVPGLSELAQTSLCDPGYVCLEGNSAPCPSDGIHGYRCPRGFYCPTGTGLELPCEPGTFSPMPGAGACLPCPPGMACGSAATVEPLTCPRGQCSAGYFCEGGATDAIPRGTPTFPLSGPCPAGHYCPEGTHLPIACPAGTLNDATGFYCLEGSEVPIPCPANTLRDLPGAVRREDCLPCPPGHWCKAGLTSFEDYPCPPGYWCPGKGDTFLCPAGTSRIQPGAKSLEECDPCSPGYYCPDPAQTGLPNTQGIPCKPGYECPAGATSCRCHGLNRAFQQSDASCICQAGYVYYDERGKKDPDSNSDQDCRPQVDELCAPGQVRLAATRHCVAPERHDCSAACGRAGGELHAELGICHCKQYISAEELCDQLCLLRAPRISLAFGINRELLLRMNGGEVREVANVLGPDEHVQNSQRVHLVLFSPSGVLGFIVSSTAVLDAFLMGDFPSNQLLQKGHRLQRTFSKDSQALPLVPNPVVCLEAGDTILFQLSIDSHDRASSHYPVYQKQHLYNSNPSWDFGPFRRLDHLIQETHLNLSWFAHVFLESGTYVFRDSTIQEHFLIVTVNEGNVSCDPRAVSFQPSSLFQLARHGVLKQQDLNLAPNWAAIAAILFVLGSLIVVLTTLAIVFQPAGPIISPLKGWKPRWRSLGEPHIPPEYILLKDSLQFYQMLGPRGSGEDAGSGEKGAAPNAEGHFTPRLLEDFSVRTLYDKLEDQNLHVASQLAQHRRDVLGFYNSISHHIQSLVVSGKKYVREGSLGKDMVQALDSDALKIFARQRICGHKPADNSWAAVGDEQCDEHCGNSFQRGSLGAPWQEVTELMKALELLLGNAPGRNGAGKPELEQKVQAQDAEEVVASLGSLASESKSEAVEGKDHELPQQCELFSRKDAFFSFPGHEEHGLDLQLPYLTELEVEGLVAASPLAKTLYEIKQTLVNLQQPSDPGNPENEKALFNTQCKVQPLLESIKRCCGCESEDEIELADEHGQVKNLLQNQDLYGSQLLHGRELCVLLKVTRHEGSQEAVFTPLLNNHSIVTPKFLAKLKKCEDSKVSTARVKTRKYTKRVNLLLEAPSTEVEMNVGQQCYGVCQRASLHDRWCFRKACLDLDFNVKFNSHSLSLPLNLRKPFPEQDETTWCSLK
ncbi:hypothetical protein WISP_67321 [Willisornis vidua]|uniref:THYG protein n=1 Tax=Willisornis vidua TaxID=1566151 RepID=A0ABQ9DE62_9PASS|nr:hypothetical protein WISP_67321 [Willisornis vidua]